MNQNDIIGVVVVVEEQIGGQQGKGGTGVTDRQQNISPRAARQ